MAAMKKNSDFRSFIRQGAGARRLTDVSLLLFENPGQTRGDLAAALGVSKVTIKNDVEELTRRGFLGASEPIRGSGGRNPAALRLAQGNFYCVGAYLRAGRYYLVIMDAAQKIVAESRKEFADGLEAAEVVAALARGVAALAKEGGVARESIVGAVLCLPGILDLRKGIAISSPALKKDKDCPVVEMLGKELGVPCRVINDADLLAVMEHQWGKARRMDSFLYLTCGYGLGMFLNGRLYQGHQGNAGEIGYMQISDSGPRCDDGRVGTLYAKAPFYRVIKTIEEIIATGGATKVADYLRPGSSRITFEMILRAIENGDQLCSQIVAEFFESVGKAAVNLAYIFNPEAIFLDEWTARCPTITVEIVQRMMGHYGVRNWRLSTSIQSADYGKDHLARGAALLAGVDFLTA